MQAILVHDRDLKKTCSHVKNNCSAVLQGDLVHTEIFKPTFCLIRHNVLTNCSSSLQLHLSGALPPDALSCHLSHCIPSSALALVIAPQCPRAGSHSYLRMYSLLSSSRCWGNSCLSCHVHAMNSIPADYSTPGIHPHVAGLEVLNNVLPRRSWKIKSTFGRMILSTHSTHSIERPSIAAPYENAAVLHNDI